MPPINKLPNYYNGKLYKHWLSVVKLENQDGLVAIKLNKGKFTQLHITNNGHKKELLYDDNKVMDIIDFKGIKRTYTYKKESNIVKGQMFTANDPEKQAPLITAAKWITRNCIPERLFLKINSQHPSSKIFIPDMKVSEKIGKTIKTKEILAKDFENPYEPLPKTIILKNEKGETEAVMSDSSKENMHIIDQLGIKSDVLGWKLRTMV